MADPGHLEEGLDGASPWYLWGPYVAERAWGTVREDYSADGDAWSYFPHDHARSRAYRWNEDGMAGLSDVFGRLCLGLALWNGRDPILKERMFGLANSEGNHGEDAKDYWWYLDALPSSAWLRWRYHYPQAEFPYEELLRVNRERSKLEGEYELLDTGVFDARLLGRRGRLREGGPDRHPDADHGQERGPDGRHAPRPADALVPQHLVVGRRHATAVDHRDRSGPLVVRDAHRSRGLRARRRGRPGRRPARAAVLRERDQPANACTASRRPRPTRRTGSTTTWSTARTRSPTARERRRRRGTRSRWSPARRAEIRLRLRPTGEHVASDPLGAAFGEVMRSRQIEADAFYAGLARDGMTADEALIMRQAFAGMLWCKQFYAYNVTRWLAGDTEAAARRAPPRPQRRAGATSTRSTSCRCPTRGSTRGSPHGTSRSTRSRSPTSIPAFAKYQLLVLCREWFQHPNGALPAYEWSFDDVNPPVHAVAAIRVWEIDGRRDTDFLQRIFHKLLLNFTWWLNRQDSSGDDLFSGGFLGLDNLSAFDRSKLPFPGRLEQSDATAWMFAYCMSMLRMASILAEHDPSYRDLMITFLEHAVRIAGAINQQGLWDEADAFYYDALHLPDGTSMPLRIHSMIGLLPVLPATSVPRGAAQLGAAFGKHFARFLANAGVTDESIRARGSVDHDARRGSLPAEPAAARLARTRAPRGARRGRVPLATRPARAVAAPPRPAVQRDGRGRHRDRRLRARRVDDRPVRRQLQLARSDLVPRQLPVHRIAAALGRRPRRDVHGRVPDGLRSTASAARRRARPGHAAGRRSGCPMPRDADPCTARYDRYATDPEWRGLLQFHEYFHGDTGAGIGASHQTGWTGLVAHLLCRGGMLDLATSGLRQDAFESPSEQPQGEASEGMAHGR